MFTSIKDWLNSKPATKAAWIGAFTGVGSLFITLLFNFFVIQQNSQAIKSSQESVRLTQQALYASINPSIEIQFPQSQRPPIIQIQNTSPYPLINISVYAVKYKFENFKLVDRTRPDQLFLSAEQLESKQTISLDASNIFQTMQFEEYNKGHFFSLILVFYRESDRKRIVKIEPFLAGLGDDNYYYLYTPYEVKEQASSGSPESMMGMTQEIEKIEKILFRVENEK